jgi:hypothetical protein
MKSNLTVSSLTGMCRVLMEWSVIKLCRKAGVAA